MMWFMKLWHWLNRRTDLSMLWPICKQHAESLDHAKAAFFLHAMNDPAYTDHFTEQEIIDYVDTLS
jgi:hypothetical protein